MMKTGFIHLNRSEFHDRVLTQTPYHWMIWTWLRATASPSDYDYTTQDGQTVHLSSGQAVASSRALGELLGVSKSTAWRYLKQLETANRIKLQPHNKFSVVTILGWDKLEGVKRRNNAENPVNTRLLEDGAEVSETQTEDPDDLKRRMKRRMKRREQPENPVNTRVSEGEEAKPETQSETQPETRIRIYKRDATSEGSENPSSAAKGNEKKTIAFRAGTADGEKTFRKAADGDEAYVEEIDTTGLFKEADYL